MEIVLAYIIMVLIGGIALWIIASLFSGDSPSIVHCFIGAGIAELVSLFGIPFIPFVVLFIVLIKIANFDAVPALFATFLYGVIKSFLFGIIVVALGGTIG